MQIIESRGEEGLTSQAIPLDDNLYSIENYRSFLETRRKILVDEVNSFLEKAKQD